MKLRGRSQELEDCEFSPFKFEVMQPLDSGSGSNASEHTVGDLDPNPSVEFIELAETSQVAKKEQVPPVKKKIGRRKRKSAEEKAANVRARNRRAQQAFRKRQKALSQEKNESRASLMEEVDELRETNRVLQSTVDSLLQQLDSQEIMRLERGRMEAPNNLLVSTTLPMLTGTPYMLHPPANSAQSLADSDLPDLLTDNAVPDLLQDLDFTQPF